VGLDAGGDYLLDDEYDLGKLEAGDDYDPSLAERYAKMKAPFPPIVLNIEGEIRDGNHRVAAAKIRGDKTIRAYVPLDTYEP
jgi:ParB-like chromosome segregation protein Spo0J